MILVLMGGALTLWGEGVLSICFSLSIIPLPDTSKLNFLSFHFEFWRSWEYPKGTEICFCLDWSDLLHPGGTAIYGLEDRIVFPDLRIFSNQSIFLDKEWAKCKHLILQLLWDPIYINKSAVCCCGFWGEAMGSRHWSCSTSKCHATNFLYMFVFIDTNAVWVGFWSSLYPSIFVLEGFGCASISNKIPISIYIYSEGSRDNFNKWMIVNLEESERENCFL